MKSYLSELFFEIAEELDLTESQDNAIEKAYNAVADWSDSSNTMRTARGWFATVRTFIRGDKEKNKLLL